MKVCVVGAGAVGSLFLAWLGKSPAAARLQLSAYARGTTLQALRTSGLRLVGDSEPTLKVTASDKTDELGPQDLVIVTVKGPALAAVAPAVARLCRPDTTVLVAMNGVPWWFTQDLAGAAQGMALQSVDPGGAINSHIAYAQVLGCVVHFSASQPAPGQVCHHNGNGLIIGEPACWVRPALPSRPVNRFNATSGSSCGAT
jgi:2-dehydropantoate 2-reductase